MRYVSFPSALHIGEAAPGRGWYSRLRDPMHPFRLSAARTAIVTRVALSYYVTSGLCAALGLFLISGGMRLWQGTFAAAVASIGVIVVVPPDQPAPRRGKFWQLLPSMCVSVPLFYAVRQLHAVPLRLGLLLVPATFVAFLGAAWGRRGIPLSMSAMFAMVFALAVPARAGTDAALATLYFASGAVAYGLYATVANSLLNARYRVQMLAETLLSMAALVRIQAAQFGAPPTPGEAGSPIGRLLRAQSELADQLQSARDLLLESPRTAYRQRLAGMLLRLLEMRDQLLACELDLDLLLAHPNQAAVLAALRATLEEHAGYIEHLADTLLTGRPAQAMHSHRSTLANLPWSVDPASDMLARGLAARVCNISDEIANLNALARGVTQPEVAVVRAYWQMFMSPTSWSWQPFIGVWHWDAPPLRHAIRAALAIATAYAIASAVPWGTHAYWILVTIVVVLRGSLAQTLERRNSRVAGTFVGSVLAGALLSVHAPLTVLMIVVTLTQGIAHAFAVKRYFVTAIAATVLALLQAHLLNADSSAAFEAFERIADTLLGVGIAWAFSYVLPAWERKQIPTLIARVLEAQAEHARLSLGLGQLTAVDDRPELEWRLARREAYDSLSALVQATQRCLFEPRAVRPPLAPLGHLVAHCYQLMAQLAAVKTMLLLRRGHWDREQLALPLQTAMQDIEAALTRDIPAAQAMAPDRSANEPLALPDPFGNEVGPWLLRRLHLASELAQLLSDDARRVVAPLASATSIRQDGSSRAIG